MTTTPDLSNLVLTSGAHGSFAEGSCLLEAVAYFAGEEFSDRPKCVSPVIAAFGRTWNDALSDADRQMLVPMIPLLVGTRTTDADEEARSFMATDWLVRTNAPAFLELAGLTEHAHVLRNLAPITDEESARVAQPALDAARTAARTAESAAFSAAESAAGSAAFSAVQSAAWSAIGSAAFSAAFSAAGSAAWSAAESAGSAAWSAAESAAWSAIGSAAQAAESAAGSALRPTVEILQSSALDLMRRMCEVGL